MTDNERKPLLLASPDTLEGVAPERVYLRLGVWAAHKQMPPANGAADWKPKARQAAVTHAPTGLLALHGLSVEEAKEVCRRLYARFPDFGQDVPHRGSEEVSRLPGWADLSALHDEIYRDLEKAREAAP